MMNITNTISKLSYLLHLIPFKIYNQLTNDSYVVLRINLEKHYEIKYSATSNVHYISYNDTSIESNKQYILSY